MARVARLALLLAAGSAAAGCGRVFTAHCESTERVVADDEVLPGGDLTVADLFADVAGERVVPAHRFRDGEPTGTDALGLTVTRGVGDAIWSDSEHVSEATPYFGIGDLTLEMLVICNSGLEVPATLAVVQKEGEATLFAEGALRATEAELAADSMAITGETADDASGWTGAYAAFTEGELARLDVRKRGNGVVRQWP